MAFRAPADEREERARLLVRATSDFEIFCRSLVVIAAKDKTLKNLRWNRAQRRYHERRTWRDVILKARQQGFSTLELARDVFKFLQPNERVLVVCQTDTSHTYLNKFSDDINRMFTGLQRAGLDLDFGVNAVGKWSLPGRNSFLQVVEAGASEAAAQKKGRGGTFSRIHSTECGFYEYPELALNAALEGVPNDRNTEIVFESTANGVGTWFHRFWEAARAGTSSYTPHFFAWYEDVEYQTPLEPGEHLEPRTDREKFLVEVVGVSQAQLKWYRAKVADKTQDLVDQEYPSDPLTCFLTSGRTFFDKKATEEHIAKVREPIARDFGGALRIWEQPTVGLSYVISADPSEGTGGDPGAAVVRERKTSRLCAVLHGQFPTWDMGALLTKLGLAYNEALVAVERNNHGHAVIQSLEHGDATTGRKPYRNIYKGTDDKLGWLNTTVTRSTALEALEKAHRDGTWSTPDARTLGEVRTFIVNKQGKAEAASGAHDDLVLAEAVCLDVLSQPVAPIPAPRAVASPYRFAASGGRGF